MAAQLRCYAAVRPGLGVGLTEFDHRVQLDEPRLVLIGVMLAEQ